MDLVDDRELLDAFRRGEAGALTAVYRALAPEVAAFLRRGFSFSSAGRPCQFRGYTSAFDVDDVTHEVFARAFTEKARLSYDGVTPVKVWLLAIAKNVVIDELRTRRRIHVPFVEGGPNEPVAEAAESAADPIAGEASQSGAPERDVLDGELVAIVREFRATLTPDEESVFRLRFEEQKSLAEVEAGTGQSPSKVKTIEKRLRARLFETLWRSGWLDGWREEKSAGWFARLKRSLVLGGKA